MPSPSQSVLTVMRGYVLPIYIPTLLSAMARGAALVLLPLYALETAEGAVLAAAVVGLRSAGTMIVDVPSGAFIDRIGDKAVMLLGLGLLVVTAVIAAFAESALLLAVVAVAFGIGTGAWLMGRLAQVTERVHFEQRGRVVSVMAGLERAGSSGRSTARRVFGRVLGLPAGLSVHCSSLRDGISVLRRIRDKVEAKGRSLGSRTVDAHSAEVLADLRSGRGGDDRSLIPAQRASAHYSGLGSGHWLGSKRDRTRLQPVVDR